MTKFAPVTGWVTGATAGTPDTGAGGRILPSTGTIVGYFRQHLGVRGPWSRRRRACGSAPRHIDQLFAERIGREPGPVSRAQALSVPAVQRGRNMIFSISTLSLALLDGENQEHRSPLLEQLDPDVPNVVTLAQTVEDLLFDGIAWWLVTAQDFAGYPVAVRHLDPSSVSLQPPADANH